MALRVPLLASLAVPIYAPTTALWALVCGTFPQYIINVSHALETRDLGTATLVSLSGSLLTLVLAPIHMMAKDDSDGEGRSSFVCLARVRGEANPELPIQAYSLSPSPPLSPPRPPPP